MGTSPVHKRSSRVVKIAEILYNGIPIVLIGIFVNLISSWLVPFFTIPQYLEFFRVYTLTIQHNAVLSIFISVLIVIILLLIRPLAKNAQEAEVALSDIIVSE